MPITKDKAPKTLPDKAKSIWVNVFNLALEEGDSEETAARKAWGAVKKKFVKKGDKWVPKSAVHEYSMVITKAEVVNDVMEWEAVGSDTQPDNYEDQATLTLFNNFVKRIDDGAPYPYLSVAHYFDKDVPNEVLKSQLGEKAVPGWATVVYVENNQLKARGYFENTPLGRAVYKAILDDIANNVPMEERIRISIGFYDLKHAHGNFVFTRRSASDICPKCAVGVGKRKFLDGELIHLAVTRVPVNPRTPIGVEMKSKKIKTRKDDAESIVGEELAEALEQLSAADGEETKSLVFRSDAEESEESQPTEEAHEVKSEADNPPVQKSGPTTLAEAMETREQTDRFYRIGDLWYTVQDVIYNILDSSDIIDKSGAIKQVLEDYQSTVVTLSLANSIGEDEMVGDAKNEVGAEKETENQVDAAQDALEEALNQFSELVRGAKSAEDLAKVDQALVNLGNVAKSMIQQTNPASLEETIRAVIRSELEPYKNELAALKAIQARSNTQVPGIPLRTPMIADVINAATQQQPVSQIKAIARRSVGFNQ